MPTDTVAVVTGASRGIGKSAALALAQEGYKTILVARSEDALKAVADEIRVSGGEASLVMPTDIADPDAIRQTVTATMDACGRIDLLFNNTGIFARGTLDLPLETYAQLLAVNLIGPPPISPRSADSNTLRRSCGSGQSWDHSAPVVGRPRP